MLVGGLSLRQANALKEKLKQQRSRTPEHIKLNLEVLMKEHVIRTWNIWIHIKRV